jgi:hypothetical protein
MIVVLSRFFISVQQNANNIDHAVMPFVRKPLLTNSAAINWSSWLLVSSEAILGSTTGMVMQATKHGLGYNFHGC